MIRTMGTAAGINVEASDTLQASMDTERTLGNNTEYIISKSMKVFLSGNYRVKFDIKSDTGEVANGRLYKNGAAIGTERQSTSSTYATHSEDITLKAGDTIELWRKVAAGGYCRIRNFRLYYTVPTTPLTDKSDA